MVQKLCMSINKYYIIIWLDNALAEDAWCIWWLCPHLPDSDDAMNISGVMNLNMHYSFSNICMWRVQDGGCEAVCMMEISVCVYQYMSGLIDSHWHALRAGPVCCSCRMRSDLKMLWLSGRGIAHCARSQGCVVVLRVTLMDFSRFLLIIPGSCQSLSKLMGMSKAVCDLIRCVFKLCISRFDVGLSSVLLHCSL